MFLQVIQGKVRDADHLKRQLERWRTELKPGAKGYLGHTGGVTADGRTIAVVRFESEADAAANSQRPEQGAWWTEASKAFDGEVTFHDCREVDTAFGGGSNKAGFVQVIQGKATDQEAMRRLGSEIEGHLKGVRPDVLGMVMGWHGDGGFTQVVYFESEAAARKGEAGMQDDPQLQQWMALIDANAGLTFYDITEPDLD